jgi:hypothetical protein
MPDSNAVLAITDCLVCDDERANGAHARERRERRDDNREGYERNQRQRTDRSPSEDSTCRSEEDRNETEQVTGRTTAKRHSRHGVELIAGVTESGLQPEREHDDACDYRQMEVAVRIAREPRLSIPPASISRFRAKIAATSK